MTSNEDLRKRRAPMEMSAEEYRKAGHELVDGIADWLESLRGRPVNRDEEPRELRRLLPEGSLPVEGADAAELLRETAPLLFDHSLFNGHPRFLGYITSSAAPIGSLAELLASAVNPNLGGWQLSPIASEIERQTVRWIADLLEYPSDCGGLLVSGGVQANFVCFLAARHAKAPWDLRSKGLAGGRGKLLIYATSETHVWIHKAVDLFGHGGESIRTIPIDENLRADVETLHKMIEEDRHRGDHPFLVIGSAGTVSTGAIDPLHNMAAVAREYDLWFHVDGAYGALAAVLPDAPEDLKKLSEADSIAVDPHKWLYAPLEAGCALVRDPDALKNAFSHRPPYYHFQAEGDDPRLNYYEYGPQNSRGFRALKVWLALRQVGRSGYARMISDDVRLAEALYRVMEASTEFEACTRELSITTFRYVPEGLVPGAGDTETYLNELNERLLERLKSSGEVFLSNAIVGGKFLLRSCVVNFRTSLEDMEALPDIIAPHGRELDRDLRPKDLR